MRLHWLTCEATKADQGIANCDIQWRMRLSTEYSLQAFVIHPDRHVPEVAQFHQFPKQRYERHQHPHHFPWHLADLNVRIAGRSADSLDHPCAVVIPLALHLKDREVVEHLGRLKKQCHRLGHVRQIGPLMGNAAAARIGDDRYGLAWFDESLGEPVVAGSRSEEISGANDQN